MRFPTWQALAAVGLSCVAACDCEDRLRKAISDPGDRKMRPDTGRPSGPSEVEPNDDSTQATAFELGTELRPVSARLSSPEDVDWFAFTVDGDEESFEVTVEPRTSLDVSVHVDVDGGTPLTYDMARRGDEERIPILKVGSTPQKFAVRAEANSSGSYTIRLKRRLGAAGLEAEPNDDASVATAIEVPGEIQGYYDRPDDRDVYRLVGEPNIPFVVELGPAKGVRQIARFFSDERLREPQLTVQITTDSSVRIPNVGLPTKGSGWLVLTPLGQPSPDAAYRIRIVGHPPHDGGLELEPNDADPMPVAFAQAGADEARTVRVSGYLHASDDRDRYELTPPELEPIDESATGEVAADEDAADDPLRAYRDKEGPRIPVSATLSWRDEANAMGLRWTDSAGNEVEFRQTSPDPEVTACGLSLDEGPAVVEVRTERLSSAPKIGEPQYELSIRETSASHSWEAEPNNDFGRADILEDARRGALAVHDDVDTYVFAVRTGGEVAAKPIRLEVGAPRVDTVLRVLDDGGGVVANVDNAAVGGEEVLRVDLPPGVYFAEVRWKGGALCVPYAIELSSK